MGDTVKTASGSIVLAGVSVPKRAYFWHHASILLDMVNILPIQPRRTFNHADTVGLAITIAGEGLLNPPVVAFFTESQMTRFLAEVKLYWGIEELSRRGMKKTTRKVRLNGGPAEEKVGYYVLLAGERRTRAVRWLFAEMAKQGQVCDLVGDNPGEVNVHIPEGVSPQAAIQIQLEENTTQVPVPPHEQAAADFRLWVYMQSKEPGLTRAEFARRTGRTEGRVARSIRFHHLPIDVQVMVSEGELIFGAALELERLQRRLSPSVEGVKTPYTEEELIALATRMSRLRLNVGDCKKVVDDEIAERVGGQLSLMDMMMSTAEQQAMREDDWRRREAAQLSAAMQDEIRYLSTVLGNRQNGETVDNSALSLPSCCRNVHHFAKQLGVFVAAVNQVTGVLTPEELTEYNQALALARELNRMLELATGAQDLLEFADKARLELVA